MNPWFLIKWQIFNEITSWIRGCEDTSVFCETYVQVPAVVAGRTKNQTQKFY